MDPRGFMMMRSYHPRPLHHPSAAQARHGAPHRLLCTSLSRGCSCCFSWSPDVDAAIVVANPLLFRAIIDRGILPKKTGVVIALAALSWCSRSSTPRSASRSAGFGAGRRGAHLRHADEVFAHFQRQPVAFFTRTQTGALVSRLNSDVLDAQSAFTNTLSSVVGNIISLWS